MSFILDALKKSELERQRQLTLGLVDAGAARRRRWPAWAVALAVLLAVNLALLSVYLWRTAGATRVAAGRPAEPAAERDGAPPAGRGAGASAEAAPPAPGIPAGLAPATAAASDPSRPPTPGAQSRPDGYFSPLDGTPEYAPEVPLAAPGERAAAPDRTTVPDRTEAHARTGDAASGVAPAATPERGLTDAAATSGASDAAASGDGDVLPSIDQLNLDGKLPALHLDVHVYATKPADRFVYINMRKYREGATLAEGPVVRAIRRDGVVLDYQGIRFLLPRQ